MNEMIVIVQLESLSIYDWGVKMNKARYYVVLLVCVICIFSTACSPTERVPQSGTWYCSELQAQFTAVPSNASLPDDYLVDNDESGVYVIVDGDKVACSWCNDRGSSKVYISCQETNNSRYELGELVYSLEFVRISASEYVLSDENGKEYTFVRID